MIRRPKTARTNLGDIVNATPKIRGGGGLAPNILAPKIFGAKTVQNFGQYCTTSDYRKCLLKEATYPKSENVKN